MYQCIGIINDEKVPGLESILNYTNEHFFNKDGPAINEQHYHITKTQYNEETHNIYNTATTNTYNIQNNIYIYIYTDEHYYNTPQNVNKITHDIIKHTI